MIDVWLLPDEAPGPQEIAEARELISRALAVMDERERRIVEMLVSGMTAAEIGAEEGLAPGTVRNLILEIHRKAEETK